MSSPKPTAGTASVDSLTGAGWIPWQAGKPSQDYSLLLISTRRGAGDKDYLQAKHTLQLLRDLWPTASVVTELLHFQRAVLNEDNVLVGGYAVVKAIVSLPNGAIGVGHKSETVEDFRDYLEKAETGAIKRALSDAGIGIQYAGSDFDYEEHNPREFVAPIGDPAPRTAKPAKQAKPAAAPAPPAPPAREPTPIRAAEPEAHAIPPEQTPIANTEHGIASLLTGELLTGDQQRYAILLSDAAGTGKKAEVMRAWADINRAKGHSDDLAALYKHYLALAG